MKRKIPTFEQKPPNFQENSVKLTNTTKLLIPHGEECIGVTGACPFLNCETDDNRCEVMEKEVPNLEKICQINVDGPIV